MENQPPMLGRSLANQMNVQLAYLAGKDVSIQKPLQGSNSRKDSPLAYAISLFRFLRREHDAIDCFVRMELTKCNLPCFNSDLIPAGSHGRVLLNFKLILGDSRQCISSNSTYWFQLPSFDSIY
jgi:hypothetical protein